MWIFEQATGKWYGSGRCEAIGYAGRDVGKNNPAMQNVKGIGPLPCGWYTIGEPIEHHPTVGAYALPLTPDPDNEMFGRSSFYVHGDSKEHPGLASHGCPVIPRAVREKVHASGDNRLQVVTYVNTATGGTEQ
jgi:hypothetical protein